MHWSLDPDWPWWNPAASIGTVVAAALAVVTIWQSYRAGRRAAERLRVERRLDFELDVLRELADLVAQSPQVSTRSAQARTRLQMLPGEVAPVSRVVFGLTTSGPLHDQINTAGAEREQVEVGPGVPVRQAMVDEVSDAIADRVDRRNA